MQSFNDLHAAGAGHFQISDDHMEIPFGRRRQAFRAARRSGYFVARANAQLFERGSH